MHARGIVMVHRKVVDRREHASNKNSQLPHAHKHTLLTLAQLSPERYELACCLILFHRQPSLGLCAPLTLGQTEIDNGGDRST